MSAVGKENSPGHGANLVSQRANEYLRRAKEGTLLFHPLPQGAISSGEDEEFFAGNKLERWALSDIIINRIVERAKRERQKRPPFGLVFSVNLEELAEKTNEEVAHAKYFNLEPWIFEKSSDPFNLLLVAFSVTFFQARASEYEHLKTIHGFEEEGVGGIFRRFEQWSDLHGKSFKEKKDQDMDAKDMLAMLVNGFNTSFLHMTNLMRVVPSVVRASEKYKGRQKDPEFLDALYKSGYSIMIDLAHRDIFSFSEFQSILYVSEEDRIYRENMFYIEDTQNGPTLKMHRINPPGRPHVSGVDVCPALPSIAGASAIHEVWGWMTDISLPVFKTVTEAKKTG